MACLKCGKETQDSRVFCGVCLEGMEAYPVKPGTAVQLPRRTAVTPDRKKARRSLTPNEELHQLRRLVRALRLVVIGLGLLLLVMAALLLFF